MTGQGVLNRCLCRRRLIFPGRFQPSIFGTAELNYRVRDGNGWTLNVINTDSYIASRFSRAAYCFGDP